VDHEIAFVKWYKIAYHKTLTREDLEHHTGSLKGRATAGIRSNGLRDLSSVAQHTSR